MYKSIGLESETELNGEFESDSAFIRPELILKAKSRKYALVNTQLNMGESFYFSFQHCYFFHVLWSGERSI